MKNISKNGNLYTDGKIKLIDSSSYNDAISDVTTNLSKNTIESGGVDIFTFSANINRTLLPNSSYYKYEISYNENGVKKKFYYTINILLNE